MHRLRHVRDRLRQEGVRVRLQRKKPVVLRTSNCMVACVTCANTCLQDAISFPSVESVRELIREEKLLVKAKEELNARREELKTEPKYD